MGFPTQDEILARFEDRAPGDFLGFEAHEYAGALTLENFRKIAKDDADLSDYEPEFASVDQVRERAKDYLDFAWDKANGCRGISANRSVMHYIAWFWLMGDAQASDALDALFQSHYEHYGKGILRAITEYLGEDWRKLDNGIWRNDGCGDGVPADEAWKSWAGREDAEAFIRFAKDPQ